MLETSALGEGSTEEVNPKLNYCTHVRMYTSRTLIVWLSAAEVGIRSLVSLLVTKTRRHAPTSRYCVRDTEYVRMVNLIQDYHSLLFTLQADHNTVTDWA